MSMLVNIGLRQGDTLFTFLFLLVFEGLVGLLHNSTIQGDFHKLKFDDDLHFEVFQFAYDTIIICDGSLDNIYSIKAILRGFELAPGLSINFHNSIFFV